MFPAVTFGAVHLEAVTSAFAVSPGPTHPPQQATVGPATLMLGWLLYKQQATHLPVFPHHLNRPASRRSTRLGVPSGASDPGCSLPYSSRSASAAAPCRAGRWDPT